jgi:hypothetical protein
VRFESQPIAAVGRQSDRMPIAGGPFRELGNGVKASVVQYDGESAEVRTGCCRRHERLPIRERPRIPLGPRRALHSDAALTHRVCVVTGYKQIKAGHLKLTKIGRKSVVAVPDALAYRDALHGTSFSR